MSEEQQDRANASDRWRTLPPRTPLEDLATGQEVPPEPQVIGDPGNTKLDEATRYPA